MRYDQFGWDAFEHGGGRPGGGFGGGGISLEDALRMFTGAFGGGGGGIFDSLFGGGRPRNPDGPDRGADLRYDLELSFEEAVFGLRKELRVNVLEDIAAHRHVRPDLQANPNRTRILADGDAVLARYARVFHQKPKRFGGAGI